MANFSRQFTLWPGCWRSDLIQYRPLLNPRELTDAYSSRAEVLCQRLGTEGAATELETVVARLVPRRMYGRAICGHTFSAHEWALNGLLRNYNQEIKNAGEDFCVYKKEI